MAKIHEEVVVLKLSTLLKDTDTAGYLATTELIDALVSVAEELSGQGVVVEAEVAE